ncbi:pyridoxamine 5'-phosphate oxidase family protein [Streptomyces sp. PKU-EA00015]|uniref:pyridoxamine 5'-phosphate oxidase family protein n=1 Tax=Streptomyces sp. PKU-EA00015 TaxID=2748326 RepID=UPI0015A1AE22|nr:pyridoxamine 5'-phosphate oxidase family protein [Streptomyces sp. PKU-EA00015]NWF27440.1 pyridoxamine 5'-phosphate oxidase family protein [Streptomyces sp. PKU-EA00015]
MTSRYAQLAFTPAVRARQQHHGSRTAYARIEQGPARADRLGDDEVGFITARDSFYLASTGESGWPYVQHRGGPPGFLRAVDATTLAFADFRGNRQYITTGNLQGNDRVALLLMDYPQRIRLKILGTAVTDDNPGPALLRALTPADYRAVVERVVLITVEAYDWNCPQHITPRYTPQEIEDDHADLCRRLAELQRQNAALPRLNERLAELEAENTALRAAVQ